MVCNHVDFPTKVMPGSYNMKGLRQPKTIGEAGVKQFLSLISLGFMVGSNTIQKFSKFL